MKKLCLAVALSTAFASMALAEDASENWKAKCKACHGEAGKADTQTGKKEKIRDMTTAEWQSKFSDEQIKAMITDGSKDNKKMKPFKEKLSGEEIDALVKHVRGFKK